MENQTEVLAALHCVDLSNPDIHQSAALVKQACMDSGFFYLINHGISEEFMNEAFAQAKKFFALPQNVKMRRMLERDRGYNVNWFTDNETKQKAHGEVLVVVHDDPDEDPENAWPPTDLPGWKETMMRYHQEALNVGRALARIIAIALDVNIDFFDQPDLLGNALTTIALNHYIVEGTNTLKEYAIGNPAHCDPYLITLLATEDVPGLQICKNVNANPRIWENVTPLKGAFIVNIGDMLERMSNGIFKSTKHRVKFRQERYTIAFFAFPSYNRTVECLPSCVSAENPAQYPPIKCCDILNYLFDKTADDDQTGKDYTKVIS